MNSIGEQDDVRIATRIHPERGSGKPRVPEAANGKDLSSRTRVRRIYIPSIAPQRSASGGLLRFTHKAQCLGLEREVTGAATKPVQKCLYKERGIVRSGEDTGMPGDSTHAAGGGIVDDSAQQLVIGEGSIVIAGCRCDLWK